MPLLADTATAQASLQNHLGPRRAQPFIPRNVLTTPFTFCDDKKLHLPLRRSASLLGRSNAYDSLKIHIRAVATLEPKCLPHKEGGNNIFRNPLLDVNSDFFPAKVESSNLDWEELDNGEKLRRIRISKANKGNVPWNKGRKHSAETLQRIRERTKLAMQNPKVKMKLAKLGHAQSKETRIKIGVGVRIGWQKRRLKQLVQETCYFDWQNMIAEASRTGYVGEEELQWDSYEVLSEKLEHEWLESVELRKRMPRPKGSKRAPKSAEQRRKIAEAIAAKWADPAYRERVCSGLAKYHGTPVGVERKLRRKPSDGKQSSRQDGPEKKTRAPKNSIGSDATTHIPQLGLQRSKMLLYKDPLASSKLELIKNIRAQRIVTETKKTEAIARARLLIAEAEKAARALEVAATRSPLARASLLETRKLIAEAIQSIESIDPGNIISNENYRTLSPASGDMIEENEMGKDKGNRVFGEAWLREVNERQVLGAGKDEDLKFSSLTFHSVLDSQKELLPTSSREYVLPSFNLESLVQQPNSEKQLGQVKSNGSLNSASICPPMGSRIHAMKEEKPSKPVTTTKKWVRGRLVEVTEGD